MNQISMNDKNINQILNLTNKVAFVVHGWVDSISGFWVNETINQWLKYQEINICTVDWNRLSSYEYTTAASKNTRLVGRYLADFLIFLVSKGLKLNETTIVGHSLGGQIAGFTGAALNGELGQIIALDPAGPLFTFPTLFSIDERLDKSDAQWVQVLHTSSNILGVQIDCGHQDFYPNAGIVPQAGCILPIISDAPNKKIVTCSHLRAVQYFVSSLNPETHCRGSNCPNYIQWFLGLCWYGLVDDFGIYNKRIQGTFWFSTSLRAPHCTGYY